MALAPIGGEDANAKQRLIYLPIAGAVGGLVFGFLVGILFDNLFDIGFFAVLLEMLLVAGLLGAAGAAAASGTDVMSMIPGRDGTASGNPWWKRLPVVRLLNGGTGPAPQPAQPVAPGSAPSPRRRRRSPRNPSRSRSPKRHRPSPRVGTPTRRAGTRPVGGTARSEAAHVADNGVRPSTPADERRQDSYCLGIRGWGGRASGRRSRWRPSRRRSG